MITDNVQNVVSSLLHVNAPIFFFKKTFSSYSVFQSYFHLSISWFSHSVFDVQHIMDRLTKELKIINAF